MLDTKAPVSEADLAAKARELAELLNSLPIPPLRPSTTTPTSSIHPPGPRNGDRVGTQAAR